MKYVVSDESVVLKSLNGELVTLEGSEDPAEMTFKQFILSRLTDPSFGKTYEDVLSASRVRTCLDDFDGVLPLETSDWERLERAVRNPEPAYNTLIAFNLIPFMKAVLEASEVKPELNSE